MTLDLVKLAKILGMCGSVHDGEALAAVRRADRLLRAAGATWDDLLGSQDKLAVASEAAAVLLAENESLRGELEVLRSSVGREITPWQDIGKAGGGRGADTRKAARWVLDLHANGEIWLTEKFEVPFLESISKWRGKLTSKQRPILERILDRVADQTGLTPPV